MLSFAAFPQKNQVKGKYLNVDAMKDLYIAFAFLRPIYLATMAKALTFRLTFTHRALIWLLKFNFESIMTPGNFTSLYVGIPS